MTSIPSVDADELAQCVSCGLCLPHCPTYRVTADERQSPRGRISLIRQWIDSGHTDQESLDALDSCIQCVGCESACPSGVQYGHLISATRAAMDSTPARAPLLLRAALGVLAHPRWLRAGSSALAVAQRAHLIPRRVALPRLPLRRQRLDVVRVDPRVAGADSGEEGADLAWFFRGCVMDAWMRDVHVDTIHVLKSAGVTVAQPVHNASCCGALHSHAGLTTRARSMAFDVMESFPGDAPIVVNSAGCGAMLKEYGVVIGTEEAVAFSRRVLDVHEFLAHPSRFSRLAARVTSRVGQPVVVQDPCHLRHAQRAHLPVRELLALVADTTETSDDGLCCGAGGSYFLTHSNMAKQLRDRKISSITSVVRGSSKFLVASANPGCAMHLSSGGVEVVHPMTLLSRHLTSVVDGHERSDNG